jgi:hypothetical protein
VFTRQLLLLLKSLVISVYSPLVSSRRLPLPDGGQYHNLLPSMFRHEVHFNAIAYLTEFGQSDCAVSHQDWSKYISECCNVGTLYF